MITVKYKTLNSQHYWSENLYNNMATAILEEGIDGGRKMQNQISFGSALISRITIYTFKSMKMYVSMEKLQPQT